MVNTEAPNWRKTLQRDFVLKCLLAATIVFVGICGGALTVTSLIGRGLWSPGPKTLNNTSLLDIGAQFPDYPLFSVQSDSLTSILQVVKNTPTVLLFVSKNCDVCVALDEFWSKRVLPSLDKSIQVVLVYDSSEVAQVAGTQSPVIGAKQFLTPRWSQMPKDGLSSTPAIVGLRGDGRIEFISSGFDKRIGARFIMKMLMH
jgi:hypothetical protein